MVDRINPSVRYVDSNYDPYSLSQEDFLNIYLTMLKLQDPTEPMKIDDMIQQQYQLQQITFMNKLQSTLDTLVSNQQITFITQASSLIGKTVIFREDKITDTSRNYVLLSPQNYENVQIQIINMDTGEVAESYTTNLQQGINQLNLNDLSAGNYLVKVYDANGNEIRDITLGSEERVVYVSLVNNQPVLGTENGERPLSDVLYIS